jgi:thioredoxin-like negative regulator of GroEL
MYCGTEISVVEAIENAIESVTSTLLKNAQENLQAGDTEEAEKLFDRVLEINPDNSEALLSSSLVGFKNRTDTNCRLPIPIAI